ncbi:MAG: hypothetical protein NVS1B7_0230 [Candidatus Saccharimonadales bacterium]
MLKTNIMAATLKTLNPIQPFGDMFPTRMRWTIKRSLQIKLALLFYTLSMVAIFYFYKNYAIALSTRKLLTTDMIVMAKTLVLPVVLFSISIYFFALGMVLARTIISVYVTPLVFLLSLEFNKTSLINSSLVLLAYLVFYFQFYSMYHEFKRPSAAKALNTSLSIFLLIFSTAITLSLYDGFSQRAVSVGSKLGDVVSQRFGFIFNANTPAEQKILKNETLHTYSIKYLKAHSLPLTPAAVKDQESQVAKGLGVVSSSPNETMESLKNRAIRKQVAQIIVTYRKLILIAVPFAFFFITQSLVSISGMIATGFLFFSQIIVRAKSFEPELPID